MIRIHCSLNISCWVPAWGSERKKKTNKQTPYLPARQHKTGTAGVGLHKRGLRVVLVVVFFLHLCLSSGLKADEERREVEGAKTMLRPRWEQRGVRCPLTFLRTNRCIVALQQQASNEGRYVLFFLSPLSKVGGGDHTASQAFDTLVWNGLMSTCVCSWRAKGHFYRNLWAALASIACHLALNPRS